MGPSTFSRIKRGAAVSAGVLAVSLASAMPANAALGNAKPGAFTLTPNLVSVSVSGSQATYRFDRQLQDNPAIVPGNFTLAPNAAAGNNAPPANGAAPGISAQVNGSTVTVGFAADRDLTKFVAGGVSAGAVQTLNQPGRTNIAADTAPVTTTNSQDGTRGFSAAPQLISVARESATVLVYTFDREVVAPGGGISGANFGVNDAGTGAATPGAGTPTIEADRVRVNFPLGTTALNAAVSAFNLDGAVVSATPVATAPANAVGNANATFSRVAFAGKTETTARPDLTEARLLPESLGFGQGTSVEYTFDDAVTAGAPANFQLILANGRRIPAGAGSISQNPATPTKLVVNFTAGAATGGQEYAVSATTAEGAGVAQGGVLSPANNADLGGNAGASASGFTVAPEVLSVTKANSNQVNVVVDTRLAAAPGTISLRTAEGSVLATPSTGSAAAAYQGNPGPKTLIYNVPGSSNVTDAVSVVFDANTFVGQLGGSRPQVVGF